MSPLSRLGGDRGSWAGDRTSGETAEGRVCGWLLGPVRPSEQEPAWPLAFPFEPLVRGNRGTRGRAGGMRTPGHHAQLWKQLHLGSGDLCPSLVPDRPRPGRGRFSPWVELHLATYLLPWDGSPLSPALGTLVRGDLGQKRPDGVRGCVGAGLGMKAPERSPSGPEATQQTILSVPGGPCKRVSAQKRRGGPSELQE